MLAHPADGPASAAATVINVGVSGSSPGWGQLAAALRRCSGAARVIVVRFAPALPADGLTPANARPDDDPARQAGSSHEAAQFHDVAPSDGVAQSEGSAAVDSSVQAAYVVAALASAPLVSIAVVDELPGDEPLSGAALALALHCDLRVFSTQASVRVSAETLGGLGRLVELIGRGRATELSLTGRRLGAAEAADIGLAAVALPKVELEAAVADLVAAVLDAPREVIIELKAAVSSSGLDHGQTRARQTSDELSALARLLSGDA